MKAKRFLIAFAALAVLASASFAGTTSYTLTTPASSTAVNYTKGAYTELGTVKVTASGFDTSYGVNVYLQTDNVFTNADNSKHKVAYNVVVGSASSHTTLENGAEIQFTASEINNGQASKTIGIVITGEPDGVPDGNYTTNLSFNAYLSGQSAPASKSALFPFGRYSSSKPILWKVLTVDTANNRALLLVNEPTADMKQPYHKDGSMNSESDQKWSNSTIKSWLSSTFTGYFTQSELNRVLKVKIDDSDLKKQDADSSQIINTSGTDQFFILSLKDTENTAYFSGNEDRQASVYGSGDPAHWWTNGVLENVEYKKKDSNESVWSKIFNFGTFFGAAGQIADAYQDASKYDKISTYYIAAVAQTGHTGIETESDGTQTFSGFGTAWATNVYIRPAVWLNTAGSAKADTSTKSAALSFEKKSEYTLTPPEGNMAMNYTKGVYNSIGTLSVTAGTNFSDTQDVLVEVQYSGKLTNTQNSGQNVTYSLIQGSESDYSQGKHTVLKNGDTIAFSAASINAKTASVPMGVVIESNPYAVSDGDYKNDITFKGSLAAIPVAGEYYTFGKYNNTPIEWRILTVDKTNRRMLLVSHYILEKTIKFNSAENPKWTESTLRTTLNGSFLNGFTDEEKSKMIKVKAEDEYYRTNQNEGDDYERFCTTKTSDHIISASGTDYVFLLTVEDAKTYFASQLDRCAGENTNSDVIHPTAYWLRTSDIGRNFVRIIEGGNYAGSITVDTPTRYSTDNAQAIGLRPAIWLKF